MSGTTKLFSIAPFKNVLKVGNTSSTILSPTPAESSRHRGGPALVKGWSMDSHYDTVATRISTRAKIGMIDPYMLVTYNDPPQRPQTAPSLDSFIIEPNTGGIKYYNGRIITDLANLRYDNGLIYTKNQNFKHGTYDFYYPAGPALLESLKTRIIVSHDPHSKVIYNKIKKIIIDFLHRF